MTAHLIKPAWKVNFGTVNNLKLQLDPTSLQAKSCRRHELNVILFDVSCPLAEVLGDLQYYPRQSRTGIVRNAIGLQNETATYYKSFNLPVPSGPSAGRGCSGDPSVLVLVCPAPTKYTDRFTFPSRACLSKSAMI